jgi:uroporphyrinogen decarboxylase
MALTPRENVFATLNFDNPQWIPKETWMLPWAYKNLKETTVEIEKNYSNDIQYVGGVYQDSNRKKGNAFEVGQSTDEWDCVFENIHDGIHGEVKNPILKDLDHWQEVVKPPYELIPKDFDSSRDIVNQRCHETDYFTRAGCNPRPWERYQFLRGTEEAMMDLVDPEDGAMDVIHAIHQYHLRELEFWVRTDVDSISFMDDWGSQTSLLISPPVWREIFKPLYKDYADLAHAHGKKIFMHSDGYIQDIYPDLVEIGIDALNSQLFVMDMDELSRIAKGKMTFWGEIDRQHVLSAKDPQIGRDAVRKVASHFYDPAGGVMAQFELSPGSHGPTGIAIHDEWEKINLESIEKRNSSRERLHA